jgi:hypothetical protein
MPLGLGPFLDQIVTLLLLIAAVLGGVQLYRKYVNPPLRAGTQTHSVPPAISSPSGAAPHRTYGLPVTALGAAASEGAMRELVTRTSRIKQWNYGPDGEVNGFLLTDGTLATIPPDLGARLPSAVGTGSKVTVTGYRSVSPSGLAIITVQSVTAKGQTFRAVG